MKLFALVVLWIAIQAGSPVPQHRDAAGNGQSTASAEGSVTVSKLPTVTVAAPKRDWADWGYWAFSLFLVIVGVLQVRLLWWTLGVVRRQAHEMKRQRALMRLQWKAMGDQASLMIAQLEEMKKSREIETKTLILQYRPKIIVRSARALDFNIAELGQPAIGKVRLSIINTGGSRARVTSGSIAMQSSATSSRIEDLREGQSGMIGPFTLQPGEEMPVEMDLSVGMTNDLQWANFHQGYQSESARFLYLFGIILYLDDLDIPRRTGVFRTYAPKTRTFVANKDSDEEYAD
jgi:hypothetical protein